MPNGYPKMKPISSPSRWEGLEMGHRLPNRYLL